MANLKVNLYGMEFLNPIMTAAGPGAKMVLSVKRQQRWSRSYMYKTISVLPADVPRPCMAKTNSGF